MAAKDEEVPEDLTGQEFVDYMNRQKHEDENVVGGSTVPGKQGGQNVKTNYIPQNQLDRQALNRKLRDEQKKEQFKRELEEDHPTLVKGVAYTKKILGTAAAKINAAGKRFVEDQDKIDKVKSKKSKNEEDEEEKPEKKKGKKKSKKLKDLFGEDEEEEDEEDSKKSFGGNKPKVILGNYKSAYNSDAGIFGSKGYSAAYKSQMGADEYHPAYRTPVRAPEQPREEPRPRAIPTPQTATIRAPDRFNTQNWKSLGFPNTLPQNARGSLFTTAPQPAIARPTLQTSKHTMPRFTSPNVIPMSGSMPRIGGMSLISGNLPTIASPALNSAKKSVGELPQLTMMGQPLNGIGKKRKK